MADKRRRYYKTEYDAIHGRPQRKQFYRSQGHRSESERYAVNRTAAAEARAQQVHAGVGGNGTVFRCKHACDSTRNAAGDAAGAATGKTVPAAGGSRSHMGAKSKKTE